MAETHLNDISKVYLDQVAEADSLAAMQARREKRLAAQRKREGTTSTGRDFGRDDSLSADKTLVMIMVSLLMNARRDRKQNLMRLLVVVRKLRKKHLIQ